MWRRSDGVDVRVSIKKLPGRINKVMELQALHGLHLVVPDIDMTRAELVERAAEVSETFHFDQGTQVPGPDPERSDYDSFFSFSDPDGNSWMAQEVKSKTG